MTAIGSLATAIGISSVEMAEGILRIAAVSLAGAIKEVSVMRGIDPRDFALLPFGGAGALHAAEVADELGMRTVVVPPLPGNFSAWDFCLDSRRYFVKTHLSRTGETTVEAGTLSPPLWRVDCHWREGIIRRIFRLFQPSISCEPRHALLGPILRIVRSLRDRRLGHGNDRAKIRRGLCRPYGATTKAPIEIVSYRVAVWQIAEKPVLSPPEKSGRSIEGAVAGRTAVIFGGVSHDVPIYQRDLLPPEISFQGPALVEEDGSSTVVPPDWSVTLDHVGCLVLRRT